jgi:glycosyltransferase involved in cell wall biosynthesis
VYACKYSLAGLLGGATFVTACNVAARDRLAAECPALAPRLHLIPHGLVLDEWAFSAPADRPHRPMRLLFVGRLVAKKGLPDLLRAVALGRDSGADLALTVAGDGPDAPALRARCAELGIESLVQWRGVVAHRDIRALLEASDALVAPSVVTAEGDRDGIPNVVMEAFAAGTPVVATDAGSLGAVVTQATGWVCRQGDPEHLLAQLDALRRNTAAACDKSRNARRLVESEYDALKLARRRAALFESALASRS